jgi:hypothetical protein
MVSCFFFFCPEKHSCVLSQFLSCICFLVVFSMLFLALVLYFFFCLSNICSLLIFYFDYEYGCENWFC